MRDIAPVLMGTSEAIRRLRHAVAVAGSFDARVLITGDTGTGKEVVAQLVHAHSARAGQQLMAVNCARIPESRLESELFGHERGSVTGAERASSHDLTRQGHSIPSESRVAPHGGEPRGAGAAVPNGPARVHVDDQARAELRSSGRHRIAL